MNERWKEIIIKHTNIEREEKFKRLSENWFPISWGNWVQLQRIDIKNKTKEDYRDYTGEPGNAFGINDKFMEISFAFFTQSTH